MSVLGASVICMRRPHENVATVLVDPRILGDIEIELMSLDMPLWRVCAAPIVKDGQRLAFQVRHRLLMSKRGEWDCAKDWVPVWIGFGSTWAFPGEAIPWPAHKALWTLLEGYADHVRYNKRLGGIPRIPRLREAC